MQSQAKKKKTQIPTKTSPCFTTRRLHGNTTGFTNIISRGRRGGGCGVRVVGGVQPGDDERVQVILSQQVGSSEGGETAELLWAQRHVRQWSSSQTELP